MSGGLVVRITSADVGRRVSVRTKLSEPGAHTTTDTVGRLLSWADAQLVIERRDGSIATLAEQDLLAGKVLIDTPPQRRSGYPQATD